jgi:hypothetical protein
VWGGSRVHGAASQYELRKLVFPRLEKGVTNMGCDIHLHVEVKVMGKWEHWNAPRVIRCYPLFAKMAGVRSNGNERPIAEPRGLPADMHPLTEWDLKNTADHSHSWLNKDEIEQLMKWWESQYELRNMPFEPTVMGGYLVGDSYSDLPEGIEDVRIVFGFDS